MCTRQCNARMDEKPPPWSARRRFGAGRHAQGCAIAKGARTRESMRAGGWRREITGSSIGFRPCRPHAATSPRVTASHSNSEVKLGRDGVVLRWGTTREGPLPHVLRFLFPVCTSTCRRSTAGTRPALRRPTASEQHDTQRAATGSDRISVLRAARYMAHTGSASWSRSRCSVCVCRPTRLPFVPFVCIFDHADTHDARSVGSAASATGTLRCAAHSYTHAQG